LITVLLAIDVTCPVTRAISFKTPVNWFAIMATPA
jgi:hypothetical protein